MFCERKPKSQFFAEIQPFEKKYAKSKFEWVDSSEEAVEKYVKMSRSSL